MSGTITLFGHARMNTRKYITVYEYDLRTPYSVIIAWVISCSRQTACMKY
jgi:hypothetical protein